MKRSDVFDFSVIMAMHAIISLGTDEPSPEHEAIVANMACDQAEALLDEMEARYGER